MGPVRRARVVNLAAVPGAPQPWVVVQLDGWVTTPLEPAVHVDAAALAHGQRVVVADVGPVPDAELVVVAALPPD